MDVFNVGGSRKARSNGQLTDRGREEVREWMEGGNMNEVRV